MNNPPSLVSSEQILQFVGALSAELRPYAAHLYASVWKLADDMNRCAPDETKERLKGAEGFLPEVFLAQINAGKQAALGVLKEAKTFPRSGTKGTRLEELAGKCRAIECPEGGANVLTAALSNLQQAIVGLEDTWPTPVFGEVMGTLYDSPDISERDLTGLLTAFMDLHLYLGISYQKEYVPKLEVSLEHPAELAVLRSALGALSKQERAIFAWTCDGLTRLFRDRVPDEAQIEKELAARGLSTAEAAAVAAQFLSAVDYVESAQADINSFKVGSNLRDRTVALCEKLSRITGKIDWMFYPPYRLVKNLLLGVLALYECPCTKDDIRRTISDPTDNSSAQLALMLASAMDWTK